MQASTLIDRCSFILTNGGKADTALREQVLHRMNDVLGELLGSVPLQSFRSVGELLVTAGQEEYELEDDARWIDWDSFRSTVQKSRLTHVDLCDLESLKDQGGGFCSYIADAGRDDVSGAIKVRVFPTNSNDALRYSYHATGPDMVETTVLDKRLPREFQSALVSGTLMEFPRFLNPTEIRLHAGKYEEAKRMLGAYGDHSSGTVIPGGPPSLGSLSGFKNWPIHFESS